MSERRYRTMQALILGGTGLFLLDKIWTGTLFLYINVRFLFLVLLAAVTLLILAQRIYVELRRNELSVAQPENQPDRKRRDRWTLLLLSIPLLLGVLIPAHTHGSQAAVQKEITAPLLAANGQTPSDLPLDADLWRSTRSTQTCSDQEIFPRVQNASLPAIPTERILPTEKTRQFD